MQNLRDKILSKAKGAAIAAEQTKELRDSSNAESKVTSKTANIVVKENSAKQPESLEAAFLHCMGLAEG